MTSPDNQPTTMSVSKSLFFKRKFFIYGFGLIVYSAVLVAVTYLFTTARNGLEVSSRANKFTRLSNPGDPMFANLQGTINGKIVKIEGTKAYVESDKGGKGIYSIEDPVFVSEISGGKLTELGSTQDKIRLNESASIRITGFGNGYRISSVTYLKDPPPVLTTGELTGTASAKPSSK